MEDNDILSLINHKYNKNFKSIIKVKGSYKVIDNLDSAYCLKVVKYNFSHFKFILSAILHLKNKGFDSVLNIIKTKDDEYFISFFGNFAFLTEWIVSKECNYSNIAELSKACEKLSELHRLSEGFNIDYTMSPRVGWFSWIKTFETRKNEILDFQSRVYQKTYKSKFDNLFLYYIKDEVLRAEKSIEGLKKSNYLELMKQEVMKRGFCHHDYASHNVLINESGKIKIIDFDYCILDTHLHDLSSIIIRAVKNTNWDIQKGKDILNIYSKNYKLRDGELETMREFIRFPQDFWQLGLQKYWEQLPKDEEFFINRLSKYIVDRKEKEEFLNKVF